MPTFMVDGFGKAVLPQPYQQEPSPIPFLITSEDLLKFSIF